MTGQHESL